MRYLGLGKTIFNSSAVLLETSSPLDVEIVLSERLLRSKYAGNWPSKAVDYLSPRLQGELHISEARDVSSPVEYEEALERSFPFYDFLEKKKLSPFSKKFNSHVHTFGHHRAHAYAALALCPEKDALIVVIDGAGSSGAHLRGIKQDLEALDSEAPADGFEYASVYDFSSGSLICLSKAFLKFSKGQKTGHAFSDSIGLFYEKISEFIFNSKHEAGKVMGLAPFGKRMVVDDYCEFLDNLDWSMQFKGKTKTEWENSPDLSFYKDLAATAQYEFEQYLENFLLSLKAQYPERETVVFTGGCALNCTANWIIAAKNIFKTFHILPFPGDESIGLGCAFGSFLEDNPGAWRPYPRHLQTSFYGPKTSVPSEESIHTLFSSFKVTFHDNISVKAAEEIANNKVIAWFQGRSECGPRALGHRSILARPDRHDLKNYLNAHIKFRESFRPYGCTCIWEKAHEYFAIPHGFENPFMSFAVPVKKEWKDRLTHVSHIDGTSRMQTLHVEQEPLFYELLKEVERLTGLPIVLNTSLNIMGEPILETLEDAVRFFKNSEVDGMCIGSAWITKVI